MHNNIIVYKVILLAPRKIRITLKLTQLGEMGDDSFTIKIASTIEQFTELLEAGFEYISDYGDSKVLRKRK